MKSPRNLSQSSFDAPNEGRPHLLKMMTRTHECSSDCTCSTDLLPSATYLTAYQGTFLTTSSVLEDIQTSMMENPSSTCFCPSFSPTQGHFPFRSCARQTRQGLFHPPDLAARYLWETGRKGWQAGLMCVVTVDLHNGYILNYCLPIKSIQWQRATTRPHSVGGV